MKIGQVVQNVLQVAHNMRGEFGAGEPNLLAGTPGAPELVQPREDGWVNERAGFGTTRDKTQGAYWQAPYGLTDPELTDLYNFHDLAAKVVDIPVREAFRSGFCFTGIDPAKLGDVEDYIRNYDLLQNSKAACTWARLYGGAAKYLKTSGTNPALPMQPGETIEAIHVIDRRFLWPFRWYTSGPKAATPEIYQVAVMGGGGQIVVIGEVHESRLVRWPGAMTEMQEKRRRQGWDMSVVQRPYEALSDSGTVWKAIQVLTVDANQAVFKIKNFWRMIAGDPSQGQDSLTGTGPSGGILKRIQFMDLMRSVSRAIVMDLDDEDFERKPTSFAGLPELSERQWVRVSAASDIPLPLLTGEYPSGLQSTGEGPFRVFYAFVQSLREQEYSPRVIHAARLLLQQKDCPVKLSEEELRKLQVKWNPIWTPTEAESADIKLKNVQFGAALVEMQAITAEEFVLGLPEEWLPAVNREALEDRLFELQNAPAEENAAARLQFTPTDLASFVSVNAALTSVGLEPLSGPEGELTVAAFRAKGEADAAPPAPAPSGFGGGKFDERNDAGFDAAQWAVCEMIWGGLKGRTDGDEDQPRDELGRFAETGASRNPVGGAAKRNARVKEARKNLARQRDFDENERGIKTAERSLKNRINEMVRHEKAAGNVPKHEKNFLTARSHALKMKQAAQRHAEEHEKSLEIAKSAAATQDDILRVGVKHEYRKKAERRANVAAKRLSRAKTRLQESIKKAGADGEKRRTALADLGIKLDSQDPFE